MKTKEHNPSDLSYKEFAQQWSKIDASRFPINEDAREKIERYYNIGENNRSR